MYAGTWNALELSRYCNGSITDNGEVVKLLTHDVDPGSALAVPCISLELAPKIVTDSPSRFQLRGFLLVYCMDPALVDPKIVDDQCFVLKHRTRSLRCLMLAIRNSD